MTPDTDRDGRPLRVGLDIRRADPFESGQQRYLWRLGSWLAARADDVHYLTRLDQPEAVDLPPGTALHRLGNVSRAEFRRRIRALHLDVLLLNPERSRDYRGIRANVLRPGYGTEHYRQKLRSFRDPVRAFGRRLLRKTPWVSLERRWERAFYEPTRSGRIGEARCRPEVIAVSRYMRDEVLDSYDIPPGHVHVVHNGVDTDEFSPERRADARHAQREEWGIPPGAFCLLFMGHNFRLKGLWQLLHVTARLVREAEAPDVHLLVAGRGTGRGQRRRADRMAVRLGIGHRVHRLGPVRPAMRAFAAADAFVHLSWHDSFGFVTLEAMAAGLPVVTTPHAGASELISDSASGLVVDPGSEDDVVRGIRTLCSPDARAAIGRAAARVASEHTEERNFEEVRRVLVRAAARCPPAIP